jgi:hypothetical protein
VTSSRAVDAHFHMWRYDPAELLADNAAAFYRLPAS